MSKVKNRGAILRIIAQVYYGKRLGGAVVNQERSAGLRQPRSGNLRRGEESVPVLLCGPHLK